MNHAGLQNLRRYFELIIFQSYLQSTEPDTMASFESVETYVKNRPGLFLFQFTCVSFWFNWSAVIKTFEKELLAEGIDALKPLERADAREGVADPDEVTRVVVNRSGSILSASTILKSDFFSNLQKMALPECVPSSIQCLSCNWEPFIVTGELRELQTFEGYLWLWRQRRLGLRHPRKGRNLPSNILTMGKWFVEGMLTSSLLGLANPNI